MNNQEHDAFREQRKSSLYWLRTATEELDTLEWMESILPSLVRRRYRISALHRRMVDGKARGYITMSPVRGVENVEAADALHADVDKLFDFLLGKCEGDDNASSKPVRKLSSIGFIDYTFSLVGLPGFESGLDVEINGLPEGSACRIIKTVTGTREVEDVEYEMVCDDEPTKEGVSVEVDKRS